MLQLWSPKLNRRGEPLIHWEADGGSKSHPTLTGIEHLFGTYNPLPRAVGGRDFDSVESEL